MEDVALANDFKGLPKQQFLSCVTGGSKKHAKELYKCQALSLWVKFDQQSKGKELISPVSRYD